LSSNDKSNGAAGGWYKGHSMNPFRVTPVFAISVLFAAMVQAQAASDGDATPRTLRIVKVDPAAALSCAVRLSV